MNSEQIATKEAEELYLIKELIITKIKEIHELSKFFLKIKKRNSMIILIFMLIQKTKYVISSNLIPG